MCVCDVVVSGLFNNTCTACTYVQLRMAALLALSAETPLGGSLYGSVAFHTSSTVSLWCKFKRDIA